jgi:hypothetical protein
MLFATVSDLFTCTLVFYNLAIGTSTESIPFNHYPTSPTSSYPTSSGPTLAFRPRGNENGRSDGNGEGQPPLEQPNSPKQVCPTDPPIPCSRPNCLGSPNPPDAYRCKSRSTTIEDSIEITLFACQCCPSILRKDVQSGTLLGKASEIWLRSYTVGSKLGVDTDDMSSEGICQTSCHRPDTLSLLRRS